MFDYHTVATSIPFDMTGGINLVRDLAFILLAAGGIGWLFQKIGFTAVTGYLLTGILISSPFVSSRLPIGNTGHIYALSQVSIVFLMFFIGFELSLPRLRQLGILLICATLLNFVLIYSGIHFIEKMRSFDPLQSLFLAAALMVSSSTIIHAVLTRAGAVHEKAARLAWGMTVLEDGVMVLFLAVLGSLTHFGISGGSEPLSAVVGTTGGWIILTIILALLIIPRFLKSLDRISLPEIQTALLIGLLLGLAWLFVKTGYSLALGAVLLGAAVSATKYRRRIERSLGGGRDIASAIFFTAVGMLFHPQLLQNEWQHVLWLSAFALIARPLIISLSLTLIGRPAGDALRASLMLTPIGEFSFIVIQLGVLSAVLPSSSYTVIIAVSVITTLFGSVLIRHANAIVRGVEWLMPVFAKRWLIFYHQWMESVTRKGQSHPLWQLSAARLLQISVQFLFVTGMLAFYGVLYHQAERWWGNGQAFSLKLNLLFAIVFGAILLIPCVALWKNVSALCLIYANAMTRGASRQHSLRPLLEISFKTIAATVLLIWLVIMFPLEISWGWALLVLAAALGLIVILFRRRITQWHSALEYELKQTIAEFGAYGHSANSDDWRHKYGGWNLTLKEVALPDQPDCAGVTLHELGLRLKFGCSVVSIERQGFILRYINAQTNLYPCDNLLLLGTEEQIEAAAAFLKKSTRDEEDESATRS
ncbi:MAG: cation:proton antiporter, partial [bacterium]